MRFEERVAIVTGAASGIGLATAKRFASEGAHVVLIDLDRQKLQDVMKEFPQGTPKPVIRLCDVSNEDLVASTIDSVLDEFKRFDIVVNNAGVMTFKPIVELTGDDWRKILSVDLLGAFYFIKQGFLKMDRGGAIVNVSSVHAVETEPLASPYAAAKTALLSLTRSASLEGASKGIRVNAVLPGAVDTPMLWNNPNVKTGAESIDSLRVGKPEEIASAIAFLASDDAQFVQGASLLVDGGRIDRL
ncbi:MAG: SDR family NAD(P)-dependent oxidoreductase [Pyrinomonadaceae bacterium]